MGLIETYAYETSKNLVCKKEEIKFNNNNTNISNFDYIEKEKIGKHNPNWPQIPDHHYRLLIIGGSGSGKINSLFNLSHQH